MIVICVYSIGTAPVSPGAWTPASAADVAESLAISQKTVERDWNFARAWLRDRLEPTESP
jgi:ECF sigma factor